MKTILSRSYLLLLLVLNLYIFQSCEKIDQEVIASGNIIEEEIIYADYSEIELNGSFDVVIKNDTNYVLTISADDNVLPFINTNISGNTLSIDIDDNVSLINATITIHISMPELTRLKSSGAMNISSANTLISNVLTVNAEGKTSIDFQLLVDYLKVSIYGNSELELTGEVKECLFDLSGVSNLSSSTLLTSDFSLTKGGNGEASVNVSDKLILKLTGNGDVFCTGNPAYIEQDIKGSGKLILR